MMMMTIGKALSLLWFFTTSFELTEGFLGHRFQCVQFGLGWNAYEWDDGDIPLTSRDGVWTIGTKPMDAKWLGSLSSEWVDLSNSDKTKVVTSPQNAKCPWTFAPMCRDNQDRLFPGESICFLSHQVQACVHNTLVRINVHLVKQGDRILQGWLHVEIELLDPDRSRDEIELIYVQMVDEQFEAIGEFVNAAVVPGAFCKDPTITNRALSTPTRHQLFPCGTTAPREVKVSQGMMMVKKEFYKQRPDPKILHVQPITKGVHFLWRMAEYWCNRHQRIQPVAWIMTKNNRGKFKSRGVGDDGLYSHGEKLYRKVPNYWIHTNWFGASDVIFKGAQDEGLDCSELAINDDNGALSSAATGSWLRASSPNLLNTDFLNPLSHYYNKNSPRDSKGQYIFEVCQLRPMYNDPTFSGRCDPTHEKWSSRDYFQECETDTNSAQFQGLNTTTFKVYDEFLVDKKEKWSSLCRTISCTVPSTREDYDGIMSYTPLNDTEDDVKPDIIVGKNDPRTRSKYFKLRAARRYHGITFSFLAFFVTPVSVFVARNYKETFMRKRCYGVHVWYWTHVGGIVATLSLGSSGHSALSQFYRVWGRATEEAASLHRLFGYVSFGSFFFLLVFGGFRIRAPGCGRICTITLHALMGFVHHWLNMASVIYSTWIPMSPSLHECNQKGMPEGLSLVFFLAVAWVAIDFVFHLILTILHIHRDRLIGIRRSWYFPIVPLADNDQMVDMAGSQVRKVFLWIYICVAFAMAVISSVFVMRNKLPKHCSFGNSTCQSWAGCTKIALKYAEWYKHQGGT